MRPLGLRSQRSAWSALCEFMHGAANIGVALNPPLVTDAAKVRKEPIAEVLNSCCARSRQENCRSRVNSCAAMQRSNRPFMQITESPRTSTTGSLKNRPRSRSFRTSAMCESLNRWNRLAARRLPPDLLGQRLRDVTKSSSSRSKAHIRVLYML